MHILQNTEYIHYVNEIYKENVYLMIKECSLFRIIAMTNRFLFESKVKLTYHRYNNSTGRGQGVNICGQTGLRFPPSIIAICIEKHSHVRGIIAQ